MLRRVARSRALRVGFALLAVALGLWAVADRWPEIRESLRQLRWWSLGACGASVLAGLAATALSWRALLADLGSPLSLPAALRVFFLGQLGKYLPGSLWPLVAQAELAREHDVPRRRSAAVGLLTMGIGLVAGLAVAAATLPLLSPDATARYWPAFVGVPVLLGLLHPAVLNPVIARGLRVLRRPDLEHPLSARGVTVAFGWAALAWGFFGVQVWVLGLDLGAHGWRLLPVAAGAFSLAWSIGFLAVFVPAGVGVREAALTAALAPVLSRGDALVVALVSRVAMTLGDLAWAGIAVVTARATGHLTVPAADEDATP